ncbi:hypothetical protein ACQHIV_36425 [Kribbella sp. GL6]|uniref:hypothetical protein n=1 Tax=Kribbella sp. GL6 TaxID=3419765 RepID=UPI003D089BAC
MVNVAALNVLPQLDKASWSAPEAIAYEIAQEGVRQAIGFCARPITEAELEADPEVVATRRAEQQDWAARGQELTPQDTRAIKRIRKDADDLLSVEDEDDDDLDDEDDDEDEDLDDEEDVDDDGTLEQS